MNFGRREFLAAACIQGWSLARAASKLHAWDASPPAALLAPPSLLHYIPPEADILVSAHVGQMVAARLYAEIQYEIPFIRRLLADNTGLVFEDLERITLAGTAARGSQVWVLALRKAARPGLVLSAPHRRRRKYALESVGKHVVYCSDAGTSFCLADPQTLVIAEAGLLQTVLKRTAPPALRPELHRAILGLDFSQPLAMAVDLTAIDSAERIIWPFDGPMLAHCRRALVQISLGDRVEVGAVLVCRSRQIAEQLTATARRQLAEVSLGQHTLPPSAVEMLRTAQVEADADRLRFQVDFPPGLFFRAVADG